MRLYNTYGKLVNKNVSQYLIDWDGKSRSKLQFNVKQFLKPFWSNMLCYEEFPAFGSLLKVDIVNLTLKIAVEIDGQQHNEMGWFHNNSPSKYLAAIKNDIKKDAWLEKNEFQLVRINYDEVDKLSPAFFKEKFDITL